MEFNSEQQGVVDGITFVLRSKDAKNFKRGVTLGVQTFMSDLVVSGLYIVKKKRPYPRLKGYVLITIERPNKK